MAPAKLRQTQQQYIVVGPAIIVVSSVSYV